MALSVDWRSRIECWRSEFGNHFYRKLGLVDLAGFTTREHLRPDQAARGPWRPMPVGTKWGGKWEYGWFKGRVVLPAEACGRRIVLTVNPGGEALIFVGGRVAGSRDHGRAFHTLAARGRPGERFDILVEAYAGHGPTPASVGPVPPERPAVPEPPPRQRAVEESSFGVWQEDAFAAWLDFETLWQVREALDTSSLRVAEIDEALRDFTTIVDFELPREERLASFRAGRRRLASLMACRNGSTAPQVFACGHGHLDVAWLWPLAETERKAARTAVNQLNLMAGFPDYKFLQSQPHLYRMVKQWYPELYARVRRAVRRGQFVPEGAMWVEADTNITGGESLIRQFLHGMRFFKEEFGVTCRMLWLPDVFGYSGALPQILRGCGIRYFSTAKIFWNYQGGDPFPHSTFVWEGIDGSEVLTHLIHTYGTWSHYPDTLGLWNRRPQKDGIATMIASFGHSDGGGGPSREHVEFLRRQRDLEGLPRVRFASPIEYFEDQELRGWPDARYVGELYFQCHRGTYTSQARTKKGNRRAEFALREAEMWGAAARATAGFGFPAAAIEEAWKQVLLCQFHDILPGSSIHRVYEEAEAALAAVIKQADETAAAARAALAGKGSGLAVFNSLSWERAALVPLPGGWACAAGAGGECLPQQKVGRQKVAEVRVPACGWTAVRPCGPGCRPGEASPESRATASLERGRGAAAVLENELLRVGIDAAGEITSIFDKEARREVAAGPCNAFRLFKDVPARNDAWDIDSMYERMPVTLRREARLELAAAGPLAAAVRVRRRINNSDLVQEVRLRRGSRRIDFVTSIDWRERHKMLKAAFPVDVHAGEAVHEIQFGHIRRPTHRSRPFDADRFEVAQQKWTALAEENRGAAVLNDCKYGVNVLGNCINLTLLRSPIAPDMTADLGRHEFTYAFYAWTGSFADCGVVREAYDLNVPVTAAARVEGRGARDDCAGSGSLFSVDAPSIVIEAVKPAEDGSGDVIVRLYESKRTRARAALTTALRVRAARECNLLEEPGRAIAVRSGRLALDFRPFEIKTVRLISPR
ncbi:MAG: alpha-mannosidase [Planctomycetes bacterium]|nr:alpha-mannosidase [Planctomycetota bacterium]